MNLKGLFIDEQGTFYFPEMGTIRGGLDKNSRIRKFFHGKPSTLKTARQSRPLLVIAIA